MHVGDSRVHKFVRDLFEAEFFIEAFSLALGGYLYFTGGVFFLGGFNTCLEYCFTEALISFYRDNSAYGYFGVLDAAVEYAEVGDYAVVVCKVDVVGVKV